MKVFSSVNDPEIARILAAGGIGVLRTDTLYGVVASAGHEAAVQRVYQLKGRDDHKSPIVLIAEPQQIYDEISAEHSDYVQTVWPGPVSIIVPAQAAPVWIQRGNGSVAYRLPDNHQLQTLLRATGPLIAPSANPQGMQPAMTIQEAIEYFGDRVDFYVDQGTVESPKPSTIIRLEPNGEVTQLR